MTLRRDSERAVLSSQIRDAENEPTGRTLIADRSNKDRRLFNRLGPTFVEERVGDLPRDWSAGEIATFAVPAAKKNFLAPVNA